jgi:hypothetical protein
LIVRANRRGAAKNAVIALLTLTATTMFPAAALLARADTPGHDDTPAAPPKIARRVRVVASGRAEDVAALGSTLRELLGRIGVTVVVQTANGESARAPTASPGDFAAVGVDLTAGGAVVVVADESGREQMRRTLPAAADRGAAIEEAAHVVQAAVEALTEEQQAGDGGAPPEVAATPTPMPTPGDTSDAAAAPVALVPPPAVPPPVTAPLAPLPGEPPDVATVRTPSSAPRYGLDLIAGLDTTIDGPRSGVVVGGEGGVIVRRARDAGWFAPSLWIIGDYHAPFRAIHDDVLVDITMISARLLPTVALARGDAWSIEGGVGAGFDVIVAEPGTTQPVSARLSPDRTDVDPILTAMVAAHTALTPSADLFIAARLDVDLGTERYDVAATNGPLTVFDPWTFRPELLVGFNVGVLGAPDYPARKAMP